MSDVNEECFCRLQLLCSKGVTPVLAKVLESIVRKTCNGDVDKFLSVFKNEILDLKKKKIINEAAYQVLFPQNANTDIYTWDISLLTCILNNFCTLEGRCNQKYMIKLLEDEAAKTGTDIRSYLAINKNIIDQNIKKQLSDDQYDKVFQTSGVNVDIKTWDFDVLLVVLSICCTGVRSKALNDKGKQLLITEIALSQYNFDLAAFLKTHLTRLNELRQNGTISNQQYELMFPTKAIDPDINTWDQWLLVIVILNVCPYLQHYSMKSIQSLRSIRNEAIAHASSPEIEESVFKALWIKIVEAIEIIIENDVQGYTILQWKDSISYIRSGPLNKQDSIDILKDWYKDRDKTNETITEFSQKLDEMRVTQMQMEEQMKKLALNQTHGFKELNDNVQVLSVRRPDIYTSRVEIQCVDIRISLQGNDIAAVRRAEDLIRQAMADEADETKKDAAAKLCLMEIKEVTTIKKEITKEGSVIVGVVEGSIIVRIQCHTLMELHYLLRYESQLVMKMHFDELAAAVGPIVGDVIKIDTGIPRYSLTALNEEVLGICLENDIELPLLVEEENQQILEEPTDFKIDDDVILGPIKSIRAKKIDGYDIKNRDDKSRCAVRSCVVLPTGSVVVCDEGNKSIKLFDETFTRRDLLTLEKAPWDSSLSLNDNNHVLVTIPDKKSIYTIRVDTRIRKERKLRLSGKCLGITCLVKCIAVTVKRGGGRREIQLLQYDGQLLQTILPSATQRLELQSPFYMTSIKGATQIIISDPSTKCLTALNVDRGKVDFVYSDPSLDTPENVTSDSEDNIYIAGRGSHTVHMISKTGKTIGDILTATDGLDSPKGLCYNKRNDTLILQPDREKSEICEYKRRGWESRDTGGYIVGKNGGLKSRLGHCFQSIRAEKIQTYNIKNQEDNALVSVDSCVVLPTGDIVVCDQVNSNIKLFDEAFIRLDLIKLKNPPYDLSLSLYEDTHVLVTVGNEKSIYTINVDKRLAKGRKLSVNGECRGITCLVTGIAVTMKRGDAKWEINLLQYDGQLLKTIRPDTAPGLQLLCHMTSINGGKHIIISDWDTGRLTAVDVATWRTDFVYKDPSLRNPLRLSFPRSLTSDSEDNTYVAGHGSNTVHVISRTGETIGDILTDTDGLKRPRGLCYNKLNDTLFLQPDSNKSEICVYKIVKDDV